MKKRTKLVALLGGLMVAIGVLAAAGTSGATTPPSVKVGPYASTTTDSNACGNAWAIDTYSRQFQVFTTPTAGTFTVVERFLNGHILTLGNGTGGAAGSPGSCNGQPANAGHMLKEGVSGSLSGSITIKVHAPAYVPADCPLTAWTGGDTSTPGNCASTGSWIDANFPNQTAAFDEPTWSFTYHALGHKYVQANTGETGDIFSS